MTSSSSGCGDDPSSSASASAATVAAAAYSSAPNEDGGTFFSTAEAAAAAAAAAIIIDRDVYDRAASDLRTGSGAAVIDLPPDMSIRIAECFRAARTAMDVASTSSSSNSSSSSSSHRNEGSVRVRTIGPEDDSAHATGYHPAGGADDDAVGRGRSMSRYNAYREGFVFSDGEMFDVPLLKDATTTGGDDAGGGGERSGGGGEGGGDGGDGGGGSGGIGSGSDGRLFRDAMSDLFRYMHDEIATGVLDAAERSLRLAKEHDGGGDGGWFREHFGPTGFASQWHVKRYVDVPVPAAAATAASPSRPHSSGGKEIEEGEEEEEGREIEWLPVHTDPSLISVVIHDVPGKNGGGMGLQYQASVAAAAEPAPASDAPADATAAVSADDADPTSRRHDDDDDDDDDEGAVGKEKENKKEERKKQRKEWMDVPYHGHAVATVFVGSVLSYITGGAFPAAKHRVLYHRGAGTDGGAAAASSASVSSSSPSPSSRVAATLFVRPRPDALLAVPPSPHCANVKVRRDCTFGRWAERVSRNYMKKKKGKTRRRRKEREGKKKEDGGENTMATGDVGGNEEDNSGGGNGEDRRRGGEGGAVGGEAAAEKVEIGDASIEEEEVQSPTQPPSYPKRYHYRDDATELTLHPSSAPPPLRGREKYLGGEFHPPTGRIYAIPGHATRVLAIDPNFDPPDIKCIGPEFRGEYKWLRGVVMGDGAVYGIPCHADSVLKIVPSTEPGEEDAVMTIQWDESDPRAPSPGLKWKWHGGAISPIDGCFYAIPQAADYVMKLDVSCNRNGAPVISFIGPPFPGRNLWYGGLAGKSDGAVYGIPQNATGVLRIDPIAQDAEMCGSFPGGGYKWHGGVSGPDGAIYGIPAHADEVLRIVPPRRPLPAAAEGGGGASSRSGDNEPEITTFGGPLRSGAHRSGDGKYKYLGGAVGADGCVYFFPSDADYVLRVDTRTLTADEVGPNLRDWEPIRHNKWQNGFASEGGRVLYGIPLKGTKVLRIVTTAAAAGDEDEEAGEEGVDGGGREPDVTTVGGPFVGLNKWEGGVASADGDMYCMPLNCDYVLRMRPLGKKKRKGRGGEDRGEGSSGADEGATLARLKGT